MRIIGGAFRGTRLVAPGGRSTRPPLDQQRETIFNVVGPRVRDARVLDVFAGSGSFGLEALSRGASHVDFVENSHGALAALEKNIASLRAEDRVAVHRVNAFSLSESAERIGSVDLVFLDPPFRVLERPGYLSRFMQILDALQPLIETPGLVVFRLPLGTGVSRAPSGATWIDVRDQGRSRVHYVHYGTDDDRPPPGGEQESR